MFLTRKRLSMNIRICGMIYPNLWARGKDLLRQTPEWEKMYLKKYTIIRASNSYAFP